MTQRTLRIAAWMMILAIVAPVAFASNPDRTGTAGATELTIPVGGRGVALGGSYMVFASGVDALYYNPAGLSGQTNGVEAEVSSMNYIADIGVVYGALGVKTGDFGNLGFSIKAINFGSIVQTTDDFPDGNGQTYSPTFITMGVTYSKALTDRIAFGFTANLVTERILEMSASGASFDIGLQYKNLGVQGLDLAVAVKNIGPSMTFAGSNLLTTATSATGNRGAQNYSINAASFDLPSLMEIGLVYTKKFGEANAVTIGGMFRNNNYLDDEYNLGGEYGFNNNFFIRGGYTFSPQAATDLAGASSYIYDYSLGVGVHYPVGDVDLTLDYGYRHQKYFTGSNVISLKIGF
ncbi:MAG TPA: PorV/PorQ family protein [Bacteroidota bacterium]|nr:PorV/PorQ family protein [Bacteroidota bacterium]